MFYYLCSVKTATYRRCYISNPFNIKIKQEKILYEPLSNITLEYLWDKQLEGTLEKVRDCFCSNAIRVSIHKRVDFLLCKHIYM